MVVVLLSGILFLITFQYFCADLKILDTNGIQKGFAQK